MKLLLDTHVLLLGLPIAILRPRLPRQERAERLHIKPDLLVLWTHAAQCGSQPPRLFVTKAPQ